MQILADVRYALRQFASTPGFTATAVLTLGLGIGATTAIFTLVHAVLLKSLPVAKPGELYRIGDVENCCVDDALQDDWSLFSYDKYKTFRDGTPGFVELAAFQPDDNRIGVRRTGTNQFAESQRSEYVSGNYFSMFGIAAYTGRMLTPQDDRKASVVGASFTFNGQPFTVIGIAPPRFFGDRLQNVPAFWIPLSDEPLLDNTPILDIPGQDWLDLIGRIKPSANVKNIEARLQVELQEWLLSPVAKLRPEERALVPKQTLHLSSGGAGVQMLRDEYQAGLRLLMAISAFVLLIACANVANLMLVRAANRKPQTSIRAALGARRSRQVGQVLTESTLLALLGGGLGVAFAFAGTGLILHLAFPKTPVAIDGTPSLPVLGFTFVISLLTGIIFGIVPAWMTAAADPADALRGANRSIGGKTGWTQKSLVVAQAALSIVLLSAAGLLIQSLRNMQNQHFGFATANRYILNIDPQLAGYKPPQLDALYRRLHDDLASIPGVAQVSFSNYTPMEGHNWATNAYIEGQAPPPPDTGQNEASWVRVSNDYFSAIGTKIVQGRSFSDQDTATSGRVAVVNQTFANKFFKQENPIGKHFGYIDIKYSSTFEIVGVTEDTMYWEPTAKMLPMFFLPTQQSVTYDDPRFLASENASHYLDAVELKIMGNVTGLEPQVRRVLANVNPNLAAIDFTSYADQVEGNFSQQKMIVKLTSLFGILALILAAVGLYGITAYSVERRTAEIGVRMALGAGRLNILGMVLRVAFLEVVAALAIGIPAVIVGGRTIASQLFGVKSYDPMILLLATAALSFATFIAAVVPAWKAASLEPIHALRSE